MAESSSKRSYLYDQILGSVKIYMREIRRLTQRTTHKVDLFTVNILISLFPGLVMTFLFPVTQMRASSTILELC
jgi:hypothetical protein